MKCVLFFVASILAVARGQIVSTGQCSTTVQALANFDVAAALECYVTGGHGHRIFTAEEYLGVWYEIAKTPTPFQAGGECSTAQYTLNEAGGFVEVNNTMVVDNFFQYDTATAVVSSTDGSAQLLVNFGGPVDSPYWVLATDYTSYALVYSCTNVDATTRSISTWKLSRTRTLDAAISSSLDVQINAIDGISSADLIVTDQSDIACYVLPDLQAGESIIIPGQCDASVAAVANFDVTRYQGLWHTIETYYSPSSTGDCGTARYTINELGTVDVLNSQVVNQNLDTIAGTATIGSTDGSGVLTVYFPSVNMEMNLLVLATDYDNYALAYGCSNINTESFQVFAFKLSRTKQLSAASAAAIVAASTSIPVLNERFYYAVDQSEAACFYYPEFVSGQTVIFPGQCDESLVVVQNFDPTLYVGRWYDIESYPSDFQAGDCNTADYTLTPEGTVDVYNTQVINQSLDTINGVAVVASTDGSAKLTVTFPIAGTNLTTSTPYWVLSTDYTSYSLVYTCVNINEYERMIWSWKLSRTRAMTVAALIAINTVVNSVDVLDARYFVAKGQTNEACFYYPEFTGNSVVFPGQCNLTISTVTNFDAARYLGTWYDLASYPSTFQGGECRTAEYSLNADGSIAVYNTQILNGYFDAINGSAVLDSTTGEAKLLVTFPTGIPGFDVTTPYWVLATDYDSYALVYTCYNNNAEERTVFGWKLSRTTSFSSAAETAIDSVIESIDVLDERYFVPSDHSEDGCRELQPGDSVILPGQCDDSIAVQANFDAEAYTGTWYEIARYASETSQFGTCNTAQYTLTEGGTVDVFNTEVVNQSLESINGTAVLNSTDGTAKLAVTFAITSDIGGITIVSLNTLPYWVISTDYTSYSLVYTCVNINENQKQVYSWQLSRTRQLTAAAQTAITSAIATVPDLNENLYLTTDQTDEGCFYFPEPTGGPVTFPGQCDFNLSVVMNFDAERYTGRWYEIESYGSDFQFGSCATAQYSLNTAGYVDVYNTQVVNQTLASISGQAYVDSTDGSAKLVVLFPTDTVPSVAVVLNYWVLATDYDNYALVYSCENATTDTRRVWSWKLSRTKELTVAATTAINTVIDSVNVLDERYYQVEDQSADGCFYYPEITEDSSFVIFPGQCDENIQAVQNFDPTRYTGKWFDVSSYTSLFVYGDCPTAEYSLTEAGTVDVFNTQVVNQTLDTIVGSAIVASTDGSAKLTVFFPDAPPEGFPYWVLATDYDSYSLVYSCVNVDSETRAVYSWKLSRTRALTAIAQSAIASTTASINVLDDRYFVDRDLTDDGCFYYPEVAAGRPVTFPGQCDASLPVQMNFDAARYTGRWNEIESYGSDFQFGSCPIAQYTLNEEGYVDVLNSQVINQSLATISGQAYVDSTDGSAKLIVLFPSTDSETTVTAILPYWVLSTDYDNYALVYSCVNATEDTRTIWTWKLSRTKELTQAAVTAINAVVDTVNVLDERYYLAANTSEEDCFYFPEPVSGQAVIFPGQCDESVSPITNFNVASFAGVWNEISSYPIEQYDTGSCASSVWTQTATGYDVILSQVLNQAFDNRTGSVLATDGEGRLILTVNYDTFTLTEELLILATDYTSYALTYSCVNIDENYRRVVSTKLSRTEVLTAAATTAINNVVNSIQVLDERYYDDSGRTEADCFFYPDMEDGPVVLSGQCPSDAEVNVVTNFDAARYLGLWHEIQRYPSIFQNGQCANAFYELNAAGTVDVTNTEILNERLVADYGNAFVATTDGRGILTVSFPNAITGVDNVLNYYIMDTDYDNFALVYSCLNLDAQTKRIYSWKLSRDQAGLTTEAVERINNVVTNFTDLFEGYYQTTSQGADACFYYPEYTGGQTNIVLPGPCDTSITAMPNFDAERYTGRWFEVARYPQNFELGECAIARYSLNADGFVDVVNTIVANQQLEIVIGYASILSTDGSGLLNVSLPIFGTDQYQNANYYVMTSDYDNFALVYSCRDLEDGNRQVSSWKLSRERTLAPQYNAIIDPVINSTQGLLEDYYVYTDQSEEACFFVPEFNAEEAVVFPGQCNEDSVPTVANFDIDSFLGLWHEIEHYPTGYTTGDCLSSNYQIENSQYIVTNTSVTGLQGVISENSFVILGNGRLRKTLANGEVIDYYVLATDYTAYALLYSCQNIDDEFRLVWSGKLSRTREMSAISNAAINQVVNSIDVLQSNFYLPVDQSDDACFYYPELSANQAVIIPGQCDAGIPAVGSFDMSEFVGRWYQTEAYSQDYESGSCVATYYQYDDSSRSVTLNILQVVDGETREFTRSATLNDGTDAVFTEEDGTATYVLATNYEEYALVYSCSNVDQYNRKISAWKLSRTRDMPVIGQAAINLVVNTRQELYQPYFVSTSQSDDCPEVSSAHVVTSSLLLLIIVAVINLFNF